MRTSVVILAAGQGKRMRSALPKVLHRVGGTCLLEHVVQTVRTVGPASLHVVYGHGGERLPQALGHLGVDWVEQAQQLGTGHAVAQALPHLDPDNLVLVLYGDVPLTTEQTLRRLLATAADHPLALLTVELDNPTGYGRIIRDERGAVVRVVEEKDASAQQRRVKEINTGLIAARGPELRRWLERLDNDNAQGEYYLTDVSAHAVADGLEVGTCRTDDPFEVLGVNDRVQLAALERHYQERRARELMLAGATLRDPARVDVRGEVAVGEDVVLDVNVILEGRVELGRGVQVGPNTVIRDSKVGDGVEILANCVIDGAVIGAGSRVGPFARLRPEAELADTVHVGNFVEIKKSTVARGAKINHLSYVGDSTVGRDVNIGAGTITCNYDGANKHRTVIGDGVFVGSGSQLVAPVTIGAGATIGAGSTVTRQAEAGALTVCRARQRTLKGWRRPTKKAKGVG